MRTFSIKTLGCKVNQYEAEQLATLLRSHGLVPADDADADIRIVHTCSVTVQAASKSRQSVRRACRVPILHDRPRARTLVTGCWATSDAEAACRIPGVDAVLGHDANLLREITRLLESWQAADGDHPRPSIHTLPNSRQVNQRAILKVQDGCDAHCTYCIIPKLRPRLWSKPVYDAVEEAGRLVAAGHVELVLTGIFLGAYGQRTAVRRRQSSSRPGLAQLVEALCTRVPALRRLRLSSLEPGDLTEDLLAILRSHPQVVPHFHLPLQSGSDAILRRMNRQYRRDDYLRMIDRVNRHFDRPAITTDIIVAFPGETEAEFQQTVDIVDRARFIHIHAFPFSPRPGTAAARWQAEFIHGPVVNQRINLLVARAADHSLAYRRQFLHQTAEVCVERSPARQRHGRTARYFPVHFSSPGSRPGDFVTVRIERVDGELTWGTFLHS